MGRFQLRSYILISLGVIPLAMTPFIIMFTGAVPEHHCRLDSGGEDREAMNASLPHTVNKLGQWRYDECRMYLHPPPPAASANDSDSGAERQLVECTQGWTYHHDEHGDTYTSQWDLVCDDAYKAALVNTIYFSGILLGSVASSHLSDQFGRKRMLLTFSILMVVVASTSAAADTYYMFIILRFIVGFCQMGIGSPMGVYIIEIFSSGDRYISQLLSSLGWTVGMMVLAGMAYGMRFYSWRYLQLLVALLHVPFCIVYAFCIPESLYWLVSKHHIDDAERILHVSLTAGAGAAAGTELRDTTTSNGKRLARPPRPLHGHYSPEHDHLLQEELSATESIVEPTESGEHGEPGEPNHTH